MSTQKIIFIFLIIICLSMQNVAANPELFKFLERQQFSGDFNSFYLNQRSCVSFAFGYDWLESIMKKIVA